MRTMAYLGPAGSFSEEAGLAYLSGGKFIRGGRPAGANDVGLTPPCRTLMEVLRELENGAVDLGIVPVDNSCEGAVQPTLDLLAIKPALVIVGEVNLTVEHNLLVRPTGKQNRIQRIVSHPQAIGQCQAFLLDHYPEADIGYADSTAQAVREVAASPEPWAAIGSARAARAYGLEVHAASINDRKDNTTRFWVLATHEVDSETRPSAGEGCRTSLVVGGYDQPGSLYEILRQFALSSINLSRIESRPARTKSGYYLFFIDIDGDVNNPGVQEALGNISARDYDIRVLGSYPKAVGKP